MDIYSYLVSILGGYAIFLKRNISNAHS